jgi:hypothetical protein
VLQIFLTQVGWIWYRNVTGFEEICEYSPEKLLLRLITPQPTGSLPQPLVFVVGKVGF